MVVDGYILKKNCKTKRDQHLVCVELSCKCRFLTILQVTKIIKNKKKYTHDANVQKLDEEQFGQEVFDQIKRKPTNRMKNFYDQCYQKVFFDLQDFIPSEYQGIRCSFLRKWKKNLPPIPKCISEVKIEGFWNKTLIVSHLYFTSTYCRAVQFQLFLQQSELMFAMAPPK